MSRIDELRERAKGPHDSDRAVIYNVLMYVGGVLEEILEVLRPPPPPVYYVPGRAPQSVAAELERELARALGKHGRLRSAHEGYAVIKEELDEMWEEVRRDDLEGALREAAQVGAMAMRFIWDLTPADGGPGE